MRGLGGFVRYAWWNGAKTAMWGAVGWFRGKVNSYAGMMI